MTVRSEPLKNGQPTKKRGAPLNRSELLRAAPWLRGGVGLALIAYSALATIDGVRVDCGPLCAGAIDGLPAAVPMWVALGIVVAVLLSLGEWIAAAARAWWVYLVFLVVDARYSQWWLDDWTLPIAQHQTGGSGVAWVVGFVVSWIGAIIVALAGEWLLFGWRKREGAGDE